MLPASFAAAPGLRRPFDKSVVFFIDNPTPLRGRTSASRFVFGFSLELVTDVFKEEMLTDAFSLALATGGERDRLEFRLPFMLEWEDEEDDVFFLKPAVADGVLNCALFNPSWQNKKHNL